MLLASGWIRKKSGPLLRACSLRFQVRISCSDISGIGIAMEWVQQPEMRSVYSSTITYLHGVFLIELEGRVQGRKEIEIQAFITFIRFFEEGSYIR